MVVVVFFIVTKVHTERDILELKNLLVSALGWISYVMVTFFLNDL